MIARAGRAETARVCLGVLLPMIAQGMVLRRPTMTAWAQRLATDRHGTHVLKRVRAAHPGGPVGLRLPGRRMLLVLEPDDVATVLGGTPVPYSPASREKRAALRHFQPHGVLISSARDRVHRRPFNEQVLQTSAPAHSLAPVVSRAVDREVTALERAADGRTGGPLGDLTWGRFAPAFWRIVRTVALGEAARLDEAVTADLDRLRRDANWAFLHPRRERRRQAMAARLEAYARTASADSLIGLVREVPAAAPTDPVGQVPHWLFAFDAAGIATFRALALLASHPQVAHLVRAEIATSGQDLGRAPALALTRACVLESVRLWPTTLAILRDSTAQTTWGATTVPAGTGFCIPSAFLHRDAERLDFADRFEPSAWLDGRAQASWSLVPFSGGPAGCPGRNLVLLVASTLIARLLDGHLCELASRSLDPRVPLPRTLDHAGLRFTWAPG